MDIDIELRTDPAVDLRDSLVLFGAPTLGLVGTITSHYLVRRLEMPRVGGMYSSYFQPITVVQRGRASPPVRVYAVEAACGLDLRCQRLVVVAMEFVPGARLAHAISDAVVRWAKDLGAPLLLVPDGAVRGEEAEGGDEGEETIWGAASTEGGLKFLESAGVAGFEEGVLSGTSGALLSAAERRGLDAVCLLAETRPQFPDANAAARIVEVLDRVLPGVHLDTEPLRKEAEEIEAAIRTMQAELTAKASAHPAHTPMFG